MSLNFELSLLRRPRRMRASHAVRDLCCETVLLPSDLVAPLFVREGSGQPEPVPSMPGVFRYSIDDLLKECEALASLNVRAVALFPCTPHDQKDDEGSLALNSDNLVNRSIRAIKKKLPDLLVITDVALDPYTSHGHDGILNKAGTHVENDGTVARLAQMALIQAQSGADFVAPSDMMDGRVGAIRKYLDKHNHTHTGILAYSAKYASAYYGPFRDAIGSKRPAGQGYLDKRTYQMSPSNVREALVEAHLDEEEGADILMVKPAGPYLDIITKLRAATSLSIAAYQVSGEYAQIHAAAQMGWLDLEKTCDESLLGIKRAGADIILTYFAHDVAKRLKGA